MGSMAINSGDLRLNISERATGAISEEDQMASPSYADISSLSVVKLRKAQLGENMEKTVYRGLLTGGQRVVIVQLRKRKFKDMDDSMHAALQNKHVVKLLGIAVDPNGSHLVTEMALMGSLDKVVEAHLHDLRRCEELLLQDFLLDIITQVCAGMMCIAQAGLVHGNLALRNVMCMQFDVARNTVHVKISDYWFRNDESGLEDSNACRWTAPEVLLGSKAAWEKSDVWSNGVLIWELLDGAQRIPYPQQRDNTTLKQEVSDGIIELEQPTHENAIKDDVVWKFAKERCLRREAETRPSFAELHRELEVLRHEQLTMSLAELERVREQAKKLEKHTAILKRKAEDDAVGGGGSWRRRAGGRHPQHQDEDAPPRGEEHDLHARNQVQAGAARGHQEQALHGNHQEQDEEVREYQPHGVLQDEPQRDADALPEDQVPEASRQRQNLEESAAGHVQQDQEMLGEHNEQEAHPQRPQQQANLNDEPDEGPCEHPEQGASEQNEGVEEGQGNEQVVDPVDQIRKDFPHENIPGLIGSYEGQLRNDIRHGKGKIVFPNGDSYDGDWKDDMKIHGRGIYTEENGDVYDGEWNRGVREGQGTLKFGDGAKYTGEFKDGQRNGSGKLLDLNDTVYDGGWKDDKMHGQCTFCVGEKYKYVGEWRDNHQNGKGKCIYANGNEYEGEWYEGKCHGKGEYKILQRNGGYDEYVGEWNDGKRHGKGKMTFSDGDVYDGEWKNGGKEGKGIFTYAKGGWYVGMWKNNAKDGKGKQEYSNGDVYDGEWKRNKKSGKGKLTTEAGTVYDGDWQSGKKHGVFTVTFRHGGTYKGKWKDGKKHGKGIYKARQGV